MVLKKGNKAEICPFCEGIASANNAQGIPVCTKHKENDLLLKCLCGSFLDTRKSKYGSFFTCDTCGPISMKKAMEMNDRFARNAIKNNKAENKNTPVAKPSMSSFL